MEGLACDTLVSPRVTVCLVLPVQLSAPNLGKPQARGQPQLMCALCVSSCPLSAVQRQTKAGSPGGVGSSSHQKFPAVVTGSRCH